MYRLMILVLGVVSVVAQPPDGKCACGKVVYGGLLKCCKKEIIYHKQNEDIDLKECFQLKQKPPTCDGALCMAKKLGYATDDGTLIKKNIMENIEKTFKDNPDLIEILKEVCVNGDISKYGRPDACDVIKNNICLQVEVVKSCDEWNDEGDCSGIKDLAAECVNKFNHS